MPNGRVYPDTLSQPTSLEELLNSVNYTQPPVETPAPPQPSQVFTEGVMTPQDRQQLVDKFLSTPDYGPEPKVDKPNLLAQILTGAGDSLTTYASILGNAPDAKTHTLATYMQYLANQKASKEKYDRRKAEGQSEAQTRKLNYILSADDRAREREADRVGRQAILDDAQVARKAIANQATAQLVAERDRKIKEDSDKAELDIKLAKMHGGFQESVARINAGVDKTQVRMDKKDLGDAITFIGRTTLGLSELLKTQTPDQIAETVRVTLDGLTLTPEARKAADAYFAKEAGAKLHVYSVQQANEELASGSPMPDTKFNLTKWMHERGY